MLKGRGGRCIGDVHRVNGCWGVRAEGDAVDFGGGTDEAVVASPMMPMMPGPSGPKQPAIHSKQGVCTAPPPLRTAPGCSQSPSVRPCVSITPPPPLLSSISDATPKAPPQGAPGGQVCACIPEQVMAAGGKGAWEKRFAGAGGGGGRSFETPEGGTEWGLGGSGKGARTSEPLYKDSPLTRRWAAKGPGPKVF